MWFSKKLTNSRQEEKFSARASALIDRLNKPLPPIIGGQKCINAETLIIVISGGSNVGKSTFIRFGLQDLIAKHDSNRPDLQCHHTKILFDKTTYPIDLIELDGSKIADLIDQKIPVIHGGIVCYDTTDRDSLDCIPDLLDTSLLKDFYLSHNIPTYLVGLKADLASATCQIDPNLIQQIVELFALRHFRVDAFSEEGVQQMQNVYKSLLKQYHPKLVDNDKEQQVREEEEEEEIKSSSFVSDTPGFIYAPTTTTTPATSQVAETIENGATSVSEADPDKELVENNHIATTFSSSHHMVNKRATSTSYYTYLGTRRGSKDSSESFGIGLTSEDVVDRLLSIEYNKSDENIIPIFLTFFRKFMKPYDLVKMLVDRFENDGLASDSSPTDLQKRIHSIFSLWLSHYWNDFYGPHARKHIILFLDRISKYEYLTPICDSLAPLVIREPPSYDLDKNWGLVDDDDDDSDADFLDDSRLSWSSTPATTKKRNEKKDSAYASGTFSVSSYIHHQPTPPSPLSSPTTNEQFLLKRLSSNNYSRNNHQQSSSTTETPLISPNLNRLLRSSSNRKAVTHSESHPNLRSSYAANNKGPLSASNNNDSCEPRRAEFAGGLINIDNIVKPKNYYTPSFKITPSIASTRTGGGWTSSLGTQLLASSFISSFRQHRSDKDQSSYNYKVFMKATDVTIADQLTWIEAELFSRIKPREFIRNIWSSSIHSDDSSFMSTSSNNAVSASIAHFNFISAWVVTMIITQTRLSKRVAVLEKFMSIAVALRNHNNYNSLMAILAGINSASILRLKQTRQAVCAKKVFKQFQSLERLMSTDRSFSSYRMALKATGAPGIPYLGIHNQDLVSLAEANKDFRADGTIHWEKFRLMGETIMATMKFKYPGYSIEPDSKILTFIADSYILSEDEQYKRSILIEPRLSSSSTNRIRDLWLRM